MWEQADDCILYLPHAHITMRAYHYQCECACKRNAEERLPFIIFIGRLAFLVVKLDCPTSGGAISSHSPEWTSAELSTRREYITGECCILLSTTH